MNRWFRSFARTLYVPALLIAGVAAAAGLLALPASAQTPTCASADSDPDGDGWGWENNASCKADDNSANNSTGAICEDPDGDGWGWDGTASCRVGQTSRSTATEVAPITSLDAPQNVRLQTIVGQGQLIIAWDAVDGAAGYALFVNDQIATRTTETTANVGNGNSPITIKAFSEDNAVWSPPSAPIRPQTSLAAASAPRDVNGIPYCTSSNASGGWGWEHGQSCRIRVETNPAPSIVTNVTQISSRTDASGQMAFVSHQDGQIRVVHVDTNGQVNIMQAEEDPNTQAVGSRAKEGTASLVSDTGWFLIDDLHFEVRDDLNRGLPETINDARNEPGWVELSLGQSALHQDEGVPGNELKFIHPDGREAVYYQTGQLATDPAIAGTYNYVNPRPTPQEWTDIKGWMDWAIYGAYHAYFDIAPWLVGGNVRGIDPDAAGPTNLPDITCYDNDCQPTNAPAVVPVVVPEDCVDYDCNPDGGPATTTTTTQQGGCEDSGNCPGQETDGCSDNDCRTENQQPSIVTTDSDTECVDNDCGGGDQQVSKRTASAVANTCDYSEAHIHGGWGWDPVNSVSCEPTDNINTNDTSQSVAPANTCDYSEAHIHGGWGWDPVNSVSCEPV